MDDRATGLAPPRAPAAIELRHLRAFVAVTEELKVGRAAAPLHLTQPSPSQQIHELERLVGYEPLRHCTQRVALTDAAEALLDRTAATAGIQTA